MIDPTVDEILGKATQLDLFTYLDLLSEEQFAAAIGLQQQTLAVWRTEGKGPAYTKVGKSVHYRRSDIARWVDRQVVYTKDDPKPDPKPEAEPLFR